MEHTKVVLIPSEAQKYQKMKSKSFYISIFKYLFDKSSKYYLDKLRFFDYETVKPISYRVQNFRDSKVVISAHCIKDDLQRRQKTFLQPK